MIDFTTQNGQDLTVRAYKLPSDTVGTVTIDNITANAGTTDNPSKITLEADGVAIAQNEGKAIDEKHKSFLKR